MKQFLKNWLTPPHFSEFSTNLSARILHIILLTVGAACFLVLIPSLFLGYTGNIVAMIFGISMVIIALYLSRRGRIQVASMILVVAMLVAITFLQIQGQGAHDVSIMVYPIIIIVASILLNRKLFILFTLLTLFSASIVILLEIYGIINNTFSAYTSYFDVLLYGIILLITAVTMRLLSDGLQSSLTLSKENEAQLQQANERLQQRELSAIDFQQRLQTLYEITLTIASTTTLDDLYRQAVELGLSHLHFDRLGLLLHDEPNNQVMGTYGTDEYGRLQAELHLRVPLEPGNPFETLFISRERLFLRKHVTLYNLQNDAVGMGWNAIASIWHDDHVIGWLAADNLIHQEPYNLDQLEILKLYANFLGQIITQRQAEYALRHQEELARQFQHKLHQLHEVNIELARSPTLTDLYRQAIVLGRETLGFDRLGLLLYDDKTQIMQGTFGTDEQGNLRDETQFQQHVESTEILAILNSKQRLAHWQSTQLMDYGQPVGIGWNAMAVLWNGDKGIGWLATDNWVKKEPINQQMLDLLTLYGATLGHLVTLKRSEEALRRYAIQLENSNKDLQNFASISSHDLQEPLRKIQTFGDRLTVRYKDRLEGQGLDYLQRMMSAAARMQTLIQDLLAFSRIESQAAPFRAVDLNSILAEVLADLEATIIETAATIHTPTLPTLEGDATQLRQLLQNLLNNALKFHRPGIPPIIHITCTERPGPPRCFEIAIADNGIGFEQEYAERIFMMFQRLHTRSEYDGSGIGLAICKRVVERHNGRIWVHSQLNEGTTFYLDLPEKQ